MATVIMPKMGDGMEEGTLLRWLKSVGEEVEAGDPIAEIETDKVTLELEAADAGVLTQTLVNEGQTVPIGTAIAPRAPRPRRQRRSLRPRPPQRKRRTVFRLRRRHPLLPPNPSELPRKSPTARATPWPSQLP
jgi:pyruvate dehydrogenase E2 component (dihydrolipoamide acetyltransferase)